MDDKEGCKPRLLSVQSSLPSSQLIHVTLHIRRMDYVNQAALSEARGTNGPWQHLISCLMTYKYSAELTVDMARYLSPWWASWVLEDQIIFSFGWEKCLIRLFLGAFQSWVALTRDFIKSFLSRSLVWVRLFPWSIPGPWFYLPVTPELVFNKTFSAIAMTPKMVWAGPNGVFKRITLPFSPDLLDAPKFLFLSMKALLSFLFLGKHSDIVTPAR